MIDNNELPRDDGAMRETARQIAEAVIRPAADDVDQQARFPREAVDALAQSGLMGLGVPATDGGPGGTPSQFVAVVEQLATACPSTAMIYVMHVAATQTLVASTCLAERQAHLQQIVAGKHLTTLALSERGSRSQFWAPVSQLETNGKDQGFRISAFKSWVTSANHADTYVCSAQTPGAQSPVESALYLLPRQSAGVSIAGRFDGLGLRGNDSAPVELKNTQVASGQLLCGLGDGATMMLQVILPWFSVGTAAMSCGLALAAVAATAEHLKGTSFDHDGSGLRDLGNLRARLAEMSMRTQQARALLAQAARSLESPDEQTPLIVLQSRMAALDAALNVTDLAMKTCGGAAFSRHLRLEQLFRDARAGWVMAPTMDHLQDFVGRMLTGLPLL